MTALIHNYMQYIINMVGIYIEVDVPYLLHSSDSTSDFILPAHDNIKADIRLDIHPVEKLPVIQDVRFTDSKRIYIGEGETAGIFFRNYPDSLPYAFASRRSVHDGVISLEYLEGKEQFMDYTRNMITLMDIEATLLDFEALILHASLINYVGQGIIFSAPSGIGKSTQAELWRQNENADILNGDRAALRKMNGIWQAFGLPYAGTSGIYKNESVPLKAIVALRQAQENRIKQIHGAEAFRYIYPETLIHRWDPGFEKKATDLLLTVFSDIPVFLLECRPEQEAVKLLKDRLAEL